jgi:hypothetical protein
MACARTLGFNSNSLVRVNVDGFFTIPTRRNARGRKLTKLQPSDIAHFENTAEDAVMD